MGDFTAYVCDNAATRPSSQTTLGRLGILIIHIIMFAEMFFVGNNAGSVRVCLLLLLNRMAASPYVNNGHVGGCITPERDDVSVTLHEPEMTSCHVTTVYGNRCEI